MEKKGKAIGNLLKKVSSHVWLFFCYWGGDREAAQVAQRTKTLLHLPERKWIL
jgi:hypothetical protein